MATKNVGSSRDLENCRLRGMDADESWLENGLHAFSSRSSHALQSSKELQAFKVPFKGFKLAYCHGPSVVCSH